MYSFLKAFLVLMNLLFVLVVLLLFFLLEF